MPMTGMTRMPAIRRSPAQLGETVLALKWHPILEENAAGAFDRLARAANWPEFVDAVRAVLRAGAELRVRRCRRQHRLRDVGTAAGSRRIGRRAAGSRRAARCRLARMGRHQSASGCAEPAIRPDRDREQRSRSRPAVPRHARLGGAVPGPAHHRIAWRSARSRLRRHAADPGRHHQPVGRLHSEGDRAARVGEASFARGIAASTTGPCRCCTRRSRRRCGGGRSPTKCPRRSTIASIATPARSDSRVFTPSSAIRGRPGSTIAPRRA